MPGLPPLSTPPPDTCDRCGHPSSDLYASYDLGWICERCAFVLDPELLRDRPWRTSRLGDAGVDL